MTHLHIQNASLAFDQHVIFSDIHFELPEGTFATLLGKSGVGKTAFLRLLTGLTDHTQASISIGVKSTLPKQQDIAYMAQTDCLLPWLNVIDNVLLSEKVQYTKTVQESTYRAYQLLEHVGLIDYATSMPHELSGGMRQRAALARTLIQNRPFIFMDEPFSALDAITRYELQNLAAKVLKRKSVILITHDPLEALRLSNVIYTMQGNPAKLEKILQLDEHTPRDVDTAVMTKHHADILRALT